MKRAIHPFVRMIAALKRMRERARQRRELAELDECALRDIGLTRADVIAATSTPPWR